MSKKLTVEDSDLQTLTLSPTNTNDDESVPFMSVVTQETHLSKPQQNLANQGNQPAATPAEKRKVEKTPSAPITATSRVFSSFKLTGTQATSGQTKAGQADKKLDLSKISRDRPAPGSSLSQRKDAPYKFSPCRTSHQHTLLDTPPISAPPPIPRRRIDISRAGRGMRVLRGGYHGYRRMDRPTQHHTFFTDAADVHQIEQGLLQLMEDFQAGNLQAFGKDSRLRQMEAIREQQEKLARLHFEFGAEQDLYHPLSEDGLRASSENKRVLMEKLAQLSESIEKLHTNAHSERKPSAADRKASLHPTTSSAVTSLFSGSTPSHQTISNSHQHGMPVGVPPPPPVYSSPPSHSSLRQPLPFLQGSHLKSQSPSSQKCPDKSLGSKRVSNGHSAPMSSGGGHARSIFVVTNASALNSGPSNSQDTSELLKDS